ncbi:hypothetical protein [Caulobacter mirabilis]|uniref:hypothetical protein n=1 Tax=Caulobacter mirabilis TaxID=69666 RepID=UPI0012378970|nr:hypothetical protein [Caulobacter mirabilis]
MGRGKAKSKPGDRIRKLSEDQLLERFSEHLQNLREICKIYDGGYAPIAFLMATETSKILTENAAATRLRALYRFDTVDYEHSESVLSPLNKLVIARVSSSPPQVTFMPAFQGGLGKDDIKGLAFRDWWERDIIYRAGAASPGVDQSLIPLRPENIVPFDKRERLTRQKLISLLRNAMGAHSDAEMPEVLDDLQSSNSFGGSFGAQMPDGRIVGTHDGTMTVKIGPLPAMMRQIAHELLEAYDRAPTLSLAETGAQ